MSQCSGNIIDSCILKIPAGCSSQIDGKKSYQTRDLPLQKIGKSPQQVAVILKGLQKSETLATGWDDDFESASVAIINNLVKRLEDYLSVEMNETDSEMDLEVSDPSAAGKGDSLQGGTPQGEE